MKMAIHLGLVHFVGFKDDRYTTAVRIFGKPDFIHRIWDIRAQKEIMEDDVVVFADDYREISIHAYDDSAFF